LRELKDQADGITRRLRIAYVSHGAVAFPTEVVAAFRRRYPTVHVDTTVGNSAMNAEHLINGSIDAAFLYPGYARDGGVVPAELALRLLKRDRALLAMSVNHPLARFEEIALNSLRREPLIMFPTSPGPDALNRFMGVLTRLMGGEPNVVTYEPPDQALEAVAHSTSLVTFANSSRAVSAPVPGVAYRRVSPVMFIDFGLAYCQDDESEVLADLLRVVDEMAKGEPGDLPEGGELLTA
jgi:DNA-binding transcriptional LysR family regulator